MSRQLDSYGPQDQDDLSPEDLATLSEAINLLRAERAVRHSCRVAMSPDIAATITRALSDGRVRDAVLVWTDYPARRLWLDLASVAPSAAVSTVRSVIAYQMGDLAGAAHHALRAKQCDPGYTLATLVLQLLTTDCNHREMRAMIKTAVTELPHVLQDEQD